ncbi:MAG: DsbA family protein, partial [Candidatus Aenigmarchaeota archaeon]|nr:DsbA family protein [Candidatus Aenigmarchaeota archaeon]
MISTFVLVVLVIIVAGFSLTGAATAGGKSQGEISTLAKNYIQQNLLPAGSTITINNVTESNGVYLLSTTYQGQNIPVYMTKDGKYMFISAIDITKPVSAPEQEEVPKTNKPTVELFVMSFCPYGVQAENTMKPVVDLLGSKVDFKVRFITSISGDTIDSVDSLHGPTEAAEDLRQVAIMKFYPDKYWSYLAEFNQNCPNVYRDKTALDACWKAAATNVGIDTKKIEGFYNTTEAINLLKQDEAAASVYGVSGSPTLIINGVQYSGSRTTDAYKTGICDAFTAAPAECSTALSSATTTATGGCAT